MLNCRIYEKRYEKKGDDTAPKGEGNDAEMETDQLIIEPVSELIFTVLDFFWHANRRMNNNKISRSLSLFWL